MDPKKALTSYEEDMERYARGNSRKKETDGTHISRQLHGGLLQQFMSQTLHAFLHSFFISLFLFKQKRSIHGGVPLLTKTL